MGKIIIENTSLAKACDDVVKKWKFKDTEALLKYAVAVMLASLKSLILKMEKLVMKKPQHANIMITLLMLIRMKSMNFSTKRLKN